MPQCKDKAVVQLPDIQAGAVLHSELCDREWLLLTSQESDKWGVRGIYPALYFDKNQRGSGVNAVIVGQDVIKLHVSDQGLVWKKPA